MKKKVASVQYDNINNHFQNKTKKYLGQDEVYRHEIHENKT